MADSSDPGSGGRGCCGGECEVNDDGECEVCVMWREIFSYKPRTDGAKRFFAPAASDGSSSSGGCGGECEVNADGAKQFLAVASDHTSRPYILGQRAALPLQVERKVEEKLREIRSELPILVKVMTATNAHGVGKGPCEMAFCMEYASACLPDRKHPLLLRIEGKSKLWRTTLDIVRQKQRRLYHGWKGFAQDNHLNVGDICIFELAGSDTQSLTMTVHLIREAEA